MSPHIRTARPADVPEILDMIRGLAEYEKALDECLVTEEQLHASLFGPSPAVYAHIAELDGAPVGIAIWFLSYSTWTGGHGVYLEDLYVRPAARGTGAGKALLSALAAICVERGYERLEWAVLDWNTPSIDFYERLGAQHKSDWLPYRLAGDELEALARRAGTPQIAEEP